MRDLKSLLILFVALGWIGCNNTIKKELPGRVDQVSPNDDSNRSVTRQTILYNNPFLFGGGGGGFGPFFMVLIKTQQFEMALRFTSVLSKRRLGSQAILRLYQNLRINYTLKQVSYRKDRDTFFIRFTTREYATSKFKDFKVDIENDTCRLVIDKPEEFLK